MEHWLSMHRLWLLSLALEKEVIGHNEGKIVVNLS